MKNKKIIDIIFIIIFWLLSIYIINPLGNFPISDDFSYANTVKRLFDTGEFKPHLWTSMTLFSQAYIGYFFSLIFNYSLEKLRILVSILGLIGIIFVYLTALELKINRKISLFIAFLLGFNPVYLHYSLSFMTDVPFFCFSIISIYFYIISLNKFSILYWVIASIFSFITILTRQVGLFIPLAFCFTYLIKERINIKNLFISLFPIICSVILYILFIKWLEVKNIKPLLYNNQGSIIEDKFALIIHYSKNIIANISFSLLYSSIFIFPLLLIFYKKIISKINYKLTFLSGFFSISIFIILCSVFKRIIPVNKNVITSLNIIGPFDDSTFYNLNEPLLFSIILSVFSIVGLFLLTLFLLNYLSEQYKTIQESKSISIQIVFLFFCLIIYQTPILLVTMYERYFFITIILLSFIIGIYFRDNIENLKLDKGFKIGILVLVIISINSIIYKKDFMTHNRFRWNIITNMIDNKISPYEIAGGFAYYGTYCNEYFKKHIQEDHSFEKNLKYYISIRPNKNMKILSKHPFNTIYKIGDSAFYVCEKIEK